MMFKKYRSFIILIFVLSLMLTTMGIASAETTSENEDLAFVYLAAVIEETGVDLEKAESTAQDMGYEHVVDTLAVGGYFEGFLDEVVDLEENDVTEEVSELAGDVKDIDEFLELEETNHITQDVIEELE